DNVKRFDGWWSLQADVFWINGFGKLQGRLSSRDAQVVCAGIGNFVDNGRMPPRSFNNSDGTFNFLDPLSRLGLDFFLGYYADDAGGGDRDAERRRLHVRGFTILMSSKSNSITKFMQCQASSEHSRTLV
ncbi:MAG: hypothetical protein ACYCQI_09045, partial [Gammaproteobacteria bacterium]